MVGFARLVTDHVTFAYVTDVYVVEAHRGRGLGAWMMRCLDEVIDGWPHLRRCMLLTGGHDPAAGRLYEQTLGMRVVDEGSGLVVMQKLGRARKDE